MSVRGTGGAGAGSSDGPVILNGHRLARERAGELVRRARAVTARRGRPPCVVVIAFAPAGGPAPYVERKVRACSAAGVTALPRILPSDATTPAALDALAELAPECDAVFVEFPFPPAVDGDALAAAIPVRLDVDVMTPARTRRYLSGEDPRPPLTVSAGIALLEGYHVSIEGVAGVLIGEETPFMRMFREEVLRRGAASCEIVWPDVHDLDARIGEGGLVIAAAGRPRGVRAAALRAGAIAIDAGYYNAGGVGDIDTAEGIDHLAAFAPVPGGIGPMTVSLLAERTIEFAEEGPAPARRRSGAHEMLAPTPRRR